MNRSWVTSSQLCLLSLLKDNWPLCLMEQMWPTPRLGRPWCGSGFGLGWGWAGAGVSSGLDQGRGWGSTGSGLGLGWVWFRSVLGLGWGCSGSRLRPVWAWVWAGMFWVRDSWSRLGRVCCSSWLGLGWVWAGLELGWVWDVSGLSWARIGAGLPCLRILAKPQNNFRTNQTGAHPLFHYSVSDYFLNFILH